MKKRILASLAALALCLTLLPVVQRADAAFVDLQFTPYTEYNDSVSTPTGIQMSDHWPTTEGFLFILYGEETLPAGVTPGDIAITKLEWSPGMVFDPKNAHLIAESDCYSGTIRSDVAWKDQGACKATVYIRRDMGIVGKMEAAGLRNTDPFTVRATQSWNGGEYSYDLSFPELRDSSETGLRSGMKYQYFFESDANKPGFHVVNAMSASNLYGARDIGNNEFAVYYDIRVRDGSRTYNEGTDEDTGTNPLWSNSILSVVIRGEAGIYDGSVRQSSGLISAGYTRNNGGTVSEKGLKAGECYIDEERTMLGLIKEPLLISKNESVSFLMCRCSELVKRNSNGEELATYYLIHSPIQTYSYTAGDPIPTEHTLTINYALAAGLSWPGAAPEPYSEKMLEGLSYNIPSPELYGLAPDKEFVTGTMGKEDQTVTVTYGTAHTLTVNYQLAPNVELPAGRSLPSACVMQVLEGGAYNVVTPKIPGLVPDKSVVIGTMGAKDKSETVTYWGQLSVTGEENGDELTYTVRYCPANALLLAARYGANGRMTYARTVAVPAGDSQDTLIMGGAGEKYKLMLVDRTTYAPLCRAWESEPDA